MIPYSKSGGNFKGQIGHPSGRGDGRVSIVKYCVSGTIRPWNYSKVSVELSTAGQASSTRADGYVG
jgi:hypothetical protein